jgi:hypothetical protein
VALKKIFETRRAKEAHGRFICTARSIPGRKEEEPDTEANLVQRLLEGIEISIILNGT